MVVLKVLHDVADDGGGLEEEEELGRRDLTVHNHDLLDLLELIFEILHGEQVAVEMTGNVDGVLRNKHENARSTWE